jgi:hypothetical protein
MFKGAAFFVLLIAGLILSAYFAFFWRRPKKVEMKLLEKSHRDLALELNSFIVSNPGEKLNRLVEDLNWLLKNDYQRDIRVKRVIHQDLAGLVAISKLREKLEREDRQTALTYRQALATITDRTRQLRHSKDETIREEILMLGEMIEDNRR